MKITATLNELLESGNWIKACDVLGINEWCLKEGLADGDEEVELTLEQAKEIGLRLNGEEE